MIVTDFSVRYEFKGKHTVEAQELIFRHMVSVHNKRGFPEFTHKEQQELMREFLRFWDDRHKQLPEYFDTLYSTKTYWLNPKPISPEGYYAQPFTQIFEQKELWFLTFTKQWPYKHGGLK